MSPSKRVLTWLGPEGWKRLNMFDMDRIVENEGIPFEDLPKTMIGKARFIIKLCVEDGINIKLNRYFDTVEYKKEEDERLFKREGGVKINV